MPTPIAPIRTEAINLALLIDVTPRGRYLVRDATGWPVADLVSVLDGTATMSEAEIEKVVAAFGVARELLGSTDPDWSGAPGFNTLMANFLRRFKIGTYGDPVVIDRRSYRTYGGWPLRGEDTLCGLMDDYEGSNTDVPGYVVAAVARAAGVPVEAMAYLSRALIADLVSIAKGRERHAWMVALANRAVDRVNTNADMVDLKVARIPVALRGGNAAMTRMQAM